MSMHNKAKLVDPNDQYRQFLQLPKLLKRYSFPEKARICNVYSRKAMRLALKEKIAPIEFYTIAREWSLETFFMLSAEAMEYSNGGFQEKKEIKFKKMIKAIEDYSLEPFSKLEADWADYYLPATALTHLDLQNSIWIKMYRYWMFFTDDSSPVRLKTTFKSKLGADYYEFLMLGLCLRTVYLKQGEVPQSLVDYLLQERFNCGAQKLTISREKYIELQRIYRGQDGDISSYIYCLRPSYQFPFVEYQGKTYIPLPHLLMQNVTSALLYRLTDGDNKLRTNIGKYIIEAYLKQIVDETGLYDEVYEEQTYIYSGSEAKSPDVLVRKGHSVLFLDSKSTVPGMGIRFFDKCAHKGNIDFVADNIKKLYNQITRFNLYNPFKGSVSEERADYWGIVVILEDAYIRREHYYRKAGELLKIKENSPDWEWLTTHIKVFDLYEIERYCFGSSDIIAAFEASLKGDRYGYSLAPFMSWEKKESSSNLLRFKERINNDLQLIVDDLNKRNLLHM